MSNDTTKRKRPPAAKKQPAAQEAQKPQEPAEAQEATPQAQQYDPETAGKVIGQGAARLILYGDYGTAYSLLQEAVLSIPSAKDLEIFTREVNEAMTAAATLLNADWEQAARELAEIARAAAMAPPTLQEQVAAAQAAAEYVSAHVAEITAALSGYMQTFTESKEYKALQEAVRSGALRQQWADRLEKIPQPVRELLPFIGGSGPEDVIPLHELLLSFDDQGNVIPDSPYKAVIERARQRKREFEAAQRTVETVEAAKEELPRITAQAIDKVGMPLDKINASVWNAIASADPNGQVAMQLDTGRKGKGKQAIVLYAINFGEIETETGLSVTKKLTMYDKRLYIAAAALFNGGNTTTTATQLYRAMGNTGKPQAADIQKINDSLTKMGAARIYVNNAAKEIPDNEIAVNKGYPQFRYDGQLLPFERISAYLNGTLTDSAIHFFREPPLVAFARQRKQISPVKLEVLESPVSKTDANLQIDDYLIERICHMKNPKSNASKKILLSTLYGNCGISSPKQRSRAPEKIKRYLEHYKKTGFIAGYTMTGDSITIDPGEA